jgi:hypothetical protein
MGSFADFLITLFESFGLYSSQNGLGEHLRGLDPHSCNDYTGQSIYNLVFIYLFVINSLVVINYYYGLFNRVPFNVWWKWLLNVLVAAAIVGVIAFMYPNNDLSTGNYCKDLHMHESDCLGFAMTAFIYSFLWSCILSLLIKWKSSVNRKVPF